MLVYGYMHSCILFIKAKVMFSVKAQWITRLDSNFLSKIVRPAAQSRSTGMYTFKLSFASLLMAYNLSCTTLNVRGLNNAHKRRQVFRWLHERRFQVIFLQEVYSSRNLERVWSAEWGGKVVYYHGTKHSRGTLVLFNPSLDVDVENYETDQRGRLIILRAKIDEFRFIFINVYAPNDQK